jgi:hypothetical protein
MNLINDILEHRAARSKRHLSGLLKRAPNYVCERGGLTAEDLVHLRLHLLAQGGPDHLVKRVERMLMEPWR